MIMLSQDAEMLNYTHAVPGNYRVFEKDRVRTEAGRRVSAAGLHSSIKCMAMVIICLLGIFYFVNGSMAQSSYEMQGLRTEIISLEKSNEKARLEVARLESPARIQSIAETRLGMHVPQKAIYGTGDVHVDQKRIHE